MSRGSSASIESNWKRASRHVEEARFVFPTGVRGYDFGFRAVKDPFQVNDRHATILGLLGLPYLFQCRKMRLTDIGGDREFAGGCVPRSAH